jgi:hypothetical protein
MRDQAHSRNAALWTLAAVNFAGAAAHGAVMYSPAQVGLWTGLPNCGT